MKTLANKVKNLFKKNKKPHPGYIYAVTKGALLGELLVYIEDVKDEHSFLSLPDMKNRVISHEKFVIGISEHILEVVERLPRYVYATCKLQHKKNKVESKRSED
jgi:hypothetical protein